MEDNQEEVMLETTDLEGIELPLETEEEEVTTEVTETKNVDEDKENLKKGLNYERKLRKEADKRNKELEARILALEEKSQVPVKSTYDELVESGVDETIAKSIASAIDKKKSDNSGLAKELAQVKFEAELTKQSKVEGFEDIEEYADDIQELVTKGLTIEQAYYASTYDKPKTKNLNSEITRKVEAKLQNTQARKEILGGLNNNAGGTITKSKGAQLSAEEKGIAAMAGMTAEEYAAFKGIENAKDFEKYNTTKK